LLLVKETLLQIHLL